MEIIILIIAWILKIIFGPIMLIYGIFAALIRQDWKYFYNIALTIDIFGNAIGKHIMNDILRKKAGYDFGNPHDTISYAIAKNWQLNTLTPFGKLIANILNTVDENHLEKALKNNEK